MTIDNCITYWAMQYKEPLKKTYNKEQGPITNSTLISTKRWLDDNFIDNTERLDKFCYYVEDNYKPTVNSPYPTNGFLTDLYNEFKKIKQSIKPFCQVEYNSITKEQKKEKEQRRIKFFKECPDKYINTDIEEIKKIAKGMSFDQQLDEFGFNLFGELHSEGVYSRHGGWNNYNKKVGKDEVPRMF